MSKSLAEKAMIADLTIGCWTGRKMDRDKSWQFAEESHAQGDAGTWWTQLVPKRDLKEITSTLNMGRSKHKQFTLPWNDSGERILPAQAFMTYTDEMRTLRAQFEEEVSDFLQIYPMIIDKAEERLGDLFRHDAYPSVEQMQRKFHWTVDFYPLPSANDFRVNLQNDEVNQIKAQIEERVEQRIENAMRDLWERLHHVISKAADTLKDPDKKFRNSLIENIVDLCDILPKLNIMEDDNLERIRQMAANEVADATPEILRVDERLRRTTANSARKIVNEIEEMFNG